MMSDINLVIKESENVTVVAKCITVNDATVNIIGSQDLTPTTTIEKCFHRCGVANAVPLEDEEIEDIPPFEVPWDKFLQHDALLGSEHPSVFPDGHNNPNDRMEAKGTECTESDDIPKTLVV